MFPIGLQAAPKSSDPPHLLRCRLLPLLLPLEYAVQLFLVRDHSTIGDFRAVGDLELRHTALPHRACYDRPIAHCDVIAYFATEDHPALSDSQVVAHLQGSVQHGVVPSGEPLADLELGALERMEGHPLPDVCVFSDDYGGTFVGSDGAPPSHFGVLTDPNVADYPDEPTYREVLGNFGLDLFGVEGGLGVRTDTRQSFLTLLPVKLDVALGKLLVDLQHLAPKLFGSLLGSGQGVGFGLFVYDLPDPDEGVLGDCDVLHPGVEAHEDEVPDLGVLNYRLVGKASLVVDGGPPL